MLTMKLHMVKALLSEGVIDDFIDFTKKELELDDDF